MERFSNLEALERLEPRETDLDRAAARRAVSEAVRARAGLLDGEDRLLLMMYLEAGSSIRQIARLLDRDPSVLTRRIHRVLERLTDETYTTCLQRRAQFSDEELAVVRDHLIRGWSLRRISRDSALGYYRVRAVIHKARRCAQAKKNVKRETQDATHELRNKHE